MRIRVLAFATVADALGSKDFEFTIDEPTSVEQFLDSLEEQTPELTAIRTRLAVAINGKLVSPNVLLADGNEVALLPPVSGGSAGGKDSSAVQLTREPIDPTRISERGSGCGAEVIFLGRVRDTNVNRRVVKISYDGYESMALAGLKRISDDLTQDGTEVSIVHRLGDVTAGEASVAIVARSPHRPEAFESCRLALERIKREIPIWKLEHYDDGSASWREEEPLELSRRNRRSPEIERSSQGGRPARPSRGPGSF